MISKIHAAIAATIITGSALVGLSVQTASATTTRTVVDDEGNATEVTPYIAWREVYSVYNSQQECEYWRSIRDEGDEDHHYWCELTDSNAWALMYRISFRP